MGELLDQAFGPVIASVPSASTKGVLYEIRRSTKGELRCSCPGFQYRRTCKHLVDAVRNASHQFTNAPTHD